MSYPSAFFALMTHKSVTCAIFPNKPGVPLTEKNQVHVYIFLETGSANFLFSRTRVFHALRLRCVFPRPSFKFRIEIFIRRTISEFIPPTTSPFPQYPPSLTPPPTGNSNRCDQNHSFNHIYVLLGSSQVTHCRCQNRQVSG